MVDHLFEARREGHPVHLPDGQLDHDQALAVQLAVSDRFNQVGDSIGGWKVGLTSGRSRDMMGQGFRPFGYVLSSRIFRSGDHIPLDRFLSCAIEPELCVVLGRDLAGDDVDERAARAAVRGVAAAFELNELRVPGGRDADHGTLLADGLGNWGMVVGDEAPADEFDLDGITVELHRDGEAIIAATAGSDLAIDSPFVSLSRLCRLLARYDRGLRAGQHIITGSFAGSPVDEPSRWLARFSKVGEVGIEFD